MKIRVNKYCSEIEWDQHLEPHVMNLVVAPTGSGKTRAFITDQSRDKNVAVLAPFTSLSEQIFLANPDFQIKTGMKTIDRIDFTNGMITSFHSAPRLLEMQNIDLLVIDEFHYLVNYAGFTYGMLNTFYDVLTKLRAKFPDMKIVALTATPHFVRLADFLDLNLIVVEQRESTAKPDSIYVSRTWTKEYKKDHKFIALYPSKKMGLAWSKKYGGAYIDSKVKSLSPEYQAIVEGKMPSQKVFTSTLLATGVSITEPVDTVYTNWLLLSDIVQMSSRPRIGGHDLKVTQTASPWFLRDGMDKPILNFGKDFEANMRLINEYSTWYSWQAHQDEADLYHIINQMLWLPHAHLPEL